MMPDRVSNPGPLTYESGALPIALRGPATYEQNSEKEKSVINSHIFHYATKFVVSVKENQERLPTFYWLHYLHKTT